MCLREVWVVVWSEQSSTSKICSALFLCFNAECWRTPRAGCVPGWCWWHWWWCAAGWTAVRRGRWSPRWQWPPSCCTAGRGKPGPSGPALSGPTQLLQLDLHCIRILTELYLDPSPCLDVEMPRGWVEREGGARAAAGRVSTSSHEITTVSPCDLYSCSHSWNLQLIASLSQSRCITTHTTSYCLLSGVERNLNIDCRIMMRKL